MHQQNAQISRCILAPYIMILPYAFQLFMSHHQGFLLYKGAFTNAASGDDTFKNALF
jgi:hypothetical protein